MKVASLSLTNYSSPAGTLSLVHEGTGISINLTETEANEFLALGYRIFERRQVSLSIAVAEMKPELLASPTVVEADYSVIKLNELNDDIPF